MLRVTDARPDEFSPKGDWNSDVVTDRADEHKTDSLTHAFRSRRPLSSRSRGAGSCRSGGGRTLYLAGVLVMPSRRCDVGRVDRAGRCDRAVAPWSITGIGSAGRTRLPTPPIPSDSCAMRKRKAQTFAIRRNSSSEEPIASPDPPRCKLMDMIQTHAGGTDDVLRAEGAKVTVAATGTPGQLILVSYLPEATVKVLHGENAGHSITYHNVVQAWTVLREWDGGATTVTVPPAAKGRARVVLAQSVVDGRPAAILGAVDLD